MAYRPGVDLVFRAGPHDEGRIPARARSTVEAAAGRVRFVALAVSAQEQERRIAHPDRREFHKLTELGVLRESRTQPAGEEPPADLRIDTMLSSASESAARIVEYFQLAPQKRQPRYGWRGDD